MDKLKPAGILKAVQTCGASFCTTDHHECPYGDDGCIDCVDRLEADFESLIAAGDNLIIRRAEPENKPCAKNGSEPLENGSAPAEDGARNRPLTLEQVKRLKPGTPVTIIHTENDRIESQSTWGFDLENDYWGYGDVADGTIKVYVRKPEGSKKS